MPVFMSLVIRRICIYDGLQMGSRLRGSDALDFECAEEAGKRGIFRT